MSSYQSTYLVGLEALMVIDIDFETSLGLFQFQMDEIAEITVGKIAAREG